MPSIPSGTMAGHSDVPAVTRARALQMFDMKVKGARNRDIALAFGCSEDTVHRTIQRAERSGVLAGAEEVIYTRLIDKAVRVYEMALDEGDVKVATKVLESTGLIRKVSARPLDPVEGNKEETWETYLVKRRTKRAPEGTVTRPGDAALPVYGAVIDIPLGGVDEPPAAPRRPAGADHHRGDTPRVDPDPNPHAEDGEEDEA